MTFDVASKQLDLFLEKQLTRSFRKGEIIVFQGEAPRGAYIVRSGIVKAYNLSVNGDEKPIAFHEKRSVIPEAWVFGAMASSTYYYEAFTPEVELFLVKREEYIRFIKKHPILIYRSLERHIMSELGGSMRLNALQHSKASDKLLYTLHYLALSHGKRLDSHTIEISLDLTHQDFANLTGLTRETAATELNKLKHLGVIDYGKSKAYKLNLSKLMKLLNDEYIAGLKF